MAYSGDNSGDNSLHGISIRQVEDESRNPPLPEDHHHHGNAARVRETDPPVFVLGAGRLSAGRFGLESFWLQIEVCGPCVPDPRRC